MPDPITEELHVDQIQRARDEREREREAVEPAEEDAASRRADKAEYLREKLAERARAEDEAASTED